MPTVKKTQHAGTIRPPLIAGHSAVRAIQINYITLCIMRESYI